VMLNTQPTSPLTDWTAGRSSGPPSSRIAQQNLAFFAPPKGFGFPAGAAFRGVFTKLEYLILNHPDNLAFAFAHSFAPAPESDSRAIRNLQVQGMLMSLRYFAAIDGKHDVQHLARVRQVRFR
jgi:hypothetical protein